MNNQIKPFGLIFAEDIDYEGELNICPIYDENESISYIRIGENEVIPFAEAYKYSIPIMGTETITLVKSESTDADPTFDYKDNFYSRIENYIEIVQSSPNIIKKLLISTYTGTKAEKEITDPDE